MATECAHPSYNAILDTHFYSILLLSFIYLYLVIISSFGCGCFLCVIIIIFPRNIYLIFKIWIINFTDFLLTYHFIFSNLFLNTTLLGHPARKPAFGIIIFT